MDYTSNTWKHCNLHCLPIRNSLQEEIFANHKILLSEEMFVVFKYCIHIRYMDPKCVLALLFANPFKIEKLRFVVNFCYLIFIVVLCTWSITPKVLPSMGYIVTAEAGP